VCSLDCARTDTQATVWADLRGRQAIVSFRGTEQVKFQDILTDINLAQVSKLTWSTAWLTSLMESTNPI